jgi:hypothetical protein
VNGGLESGLRVWQEGKKGGALANHHPEMLKHNKEDFEKRIKDT